jgi:hypothetical protein
VAPLASFKEVQNWRRMILLSSQGKHVEALDAARSAAPAVKTMAAWQVFEMQQLALLKEYSSVLARAQPFARALLLKGARTADEKYFLVLTQWYGQVAFRRLHPSEAVPLELSFDPKSVPLSRVTKRWKRSFPMTIHPDWRGASTSQK